MKIIGITDAGNFEDEPTYLEIPDNLNLGTENKAWKAAGEPNSFIDWLLEHGAEKHEFDVFYYSTAPRPVDPKDVPMLQMWAVESLQMAKEKVFWSNFLGWKNVP